MIAVERLTAANEKLESDEIVQIYINLAQSGRNGPNTRQN